jgi:putative sterol carrier protein
MDATTQFFTQLEALGHESRLEKVKGSLRLELVNGRRTDRWLITIDKGDIAVSRGNGEADCVVRTTKEVFEGLTTGQTNAVAAVLRGTVGVEGDRGLLVHFQRLFPAAMAAS